MSDHGTNLYTAQRIAQHRLDEAARRAEHAWTTTIARQPRSAPRATTASSTRWAVAAALVAGVMMTAACGTDTTSQGPPANAPVQARIYPRTDVPEVSPGLMPADAAERRMTQNEEKLRRAGGNTTASSACNWTVEQLPRTPGAGEGWYHDC